MAGSAHLKLGPDIEMLIDFCIFLFN
jgi:hypothetical protein